MAEHSEMVKAEEHLATRRRTEIGSAAEHGVRAGAGYAAMLLRQVNLGGRGNAPIRAQLLLDMQRTHGNRAVQRQEYSPALPPFLMGPLTMGWDYLLHSLGPSSLPPFNPGQPSIPEMVQEHIAKVQGTKAFYEGEQARKHDIAIGDAQRAITGRPAEWAMLPDHSPGTLEEPQYEDVSPALNPWELQELERERELMEAARR